MNGLVPDTDKATMAEVAKGLLEGMTLDDEEKKLMAAKKKLTVAQKKEVREAERAETAATAPKKTAKDDIDLLLGDLNKILDGRGRISRGSEIEDIQYERRSSGILTLDVVLNGGLPKGAQIEVGGPYSSGKSTTALQILAHNQRTLGERAAWVALEPFSKRWARQNGFFVPFHPKNDPFEKATKIELLRMEQQGITDPYANITDFVLLQEQRGDTALKVAVELVKSNKFAFVVIDSLGLAKSTKFLDEKDTEDAEDYDRTPKMIGDYSARVNLALNARYDAEGNIAKHGDFFNQTTVINLNQIVTNIGTMARSAHKKFGMKGGEGLKHNQHAILFVNKGQQLRKEMPGDRPALIYGQEVDVTCIKSKVGPPERQGSWNLYFEEFDGFYPGDVDIARDVFINANLCDLLGRTGAWYEFAGVKVNGIDAAVEVIRQNPDVQQWLWDQVLAIRCGTGTITA